VIASFATSTDLDILVVGRDEKRPEGWWEAGIASKPFAATGVIAALLLTILRLAL
jgi:hypothetical protein